jgi:hypothetical protein
MLLLAACSGAFAQSSGVAYLLSMTQESHLARRCVLLSADGNFHVEELEESAIRIYEGRISPPALRQLAITLDRPALVALSQERIEEPLTGDFHQRLFLNIFRRDHWQKLAFQSDVSQSQHDTSLRPLLRWLDNLHKVRHTNLTEDEGRNNCQVPRKLELKRRAPVAGATDERLTAPRSWHDSPASPPPFVPAPGVLFRLELTEVASKGAHQQCALFISDGRYRFEDRVQKNGKKPVASRAADGRITPGQLTQLQRILDNPALMRIKHHQPPGGMQVRMMGDILHLWITRDQRIQELVLSSNQRQTGFFYTGDGDARTADPLLEFISEHIEKNGTAPATGAQLNGCTEVAGE